MRDNLRDETASTADELGDLHVPVARIEDGKQRCPHCGGVSSDLVTLPTDDVFPSPQREHSPVVPE